MKTTKALLLILLMAGLSTTSLKAAENNEECLKQSVQSLVISEFNKWDFSSLNEQEASADVSFELKEDGQLQLQEVSSDNLSLTKIIKDNFSNIQLRSDCLIPGKSFVVRLKHRRA